MNHLALLFYFFSAVVVVSSFLVVLNRRPAYSVLALTLTMLALSALFILLEAYFVAVIQILIYAGAILVLFLFVMMLLGIEGSEKAAGKDTSFLGRFQPFIQIALVILLLVELGWAVFQWSQPHEVTNVMIGNVESIGEALFGRYLLPFELVSGILLIGIFGVVNLSHEEREK